MIRTFVGLTKRTRKSKALECAVSKLGGAYESSNHLFIQQCPSHRLSGYAASGWSNPGRFFSSPLDPTQASQASPQALRGVAASHVSHSPCSEPSPPCLSPDGTLAPSFHCHSRLGRAANATAGMFPEQFLSAKPTRFCTFVHHISPSMGASHPW